MVRYAGDPYWTRARFGTCCKCGKNVKGQRIFYYPKGKHVYCSECGQEESSRFNEAAWDEEQYINSYPSY